MKTTQDRMKLLPQKIKCRGYSNAGNLVNKVLWICHIEIIKNDGTTYICESGRFMHPQPLKRDAVRIGNEYKEYMISAGDFYLT